MTMLLSTETEGEGNDYPVSIDTAATPKKKVKRTTGTRGDSWYIALWPWLKESTSLGILLFWGSQTSCSLFIEM